MSDFQKDLDYTLEPEILKKVQWALARYYEKKEKASEIVDDDAYEFYPLPHYGTDPVAYTSVPSRRTENLAFDIIELKAQIKDAKDLVEGVDKGIHRAARTVKTPKLVSSYNDALRDHMIDRIPNRPYVPDFVPNSGKNRRIKMRPDTLRTYKRRAFYFIAVELHLIEADEGVLRAEARNERSLSRG